ncbi:MAG: class I SAM-dependent methyltransferase [Candidatus Thorarchaeota archaeon]|nr:class I SAM-dependent methyltransferase [Candidatus Thorarchaeota archaeon]
MSEFKSTKSYRDAAEYYDLFTVSNDIPFYLSMAEKYGSPILELACGTGRVALKLAEADYEVVGVDATRQMLKVAREKASNLPGNVRCPVSFLRGDVTDLDLQQKFPLVIIPSSFRFCLTTEEQLECLSSAKRHLTEDGVFILDLYPGDGQQEEGEWSEEAHTTSGRHVKRSGRFVADFSKQIQYRTFILEITESDGETWTIETENAVALINDKEADRLLRLSGFEVLKEYGDWDFKPYSPGMRRRILVLRARSSDRSD